MLGYSREELLAMNSFDILDEESKARFQARIVRWLRGEEPDRNVEYKVRTKEGHTLDVVLDVTFTADENGKPLGATVIGHDITERKRADEALQESRKDLDRAQTVGKIGSWRLDIDRNVLTWSDENHRIFGVPRGTPLTYETFLSLVHPDDREYVDTRWKAGLSGEPYDIEHRILVDGRVKWVREKAYLEFDDAGGLLGGFGITQDITERKRAEEALVRHTEELTRLHRELQIANREANLYLDILTHDIGNTENVSNLYADLLNRPRRRRPEDLRGETAAERPEEHRDLKDGLHHPPDSPGVVRAQTDGSRRGRPGSDRGLPGQHYSLRRGALSGLG